MDPATLTSLITALVFVVILVVLLVKTAVVVPQKSHFVVERLGKYSKTIGAGLHILIPFIDQIAYKRSLKEEVMDIPAQSCITRDNVSVTIDGVLYIRVIDAKMSCYGIENYYIAASQLAQTSLRSAIGKIDLDKTFEERETINYSVIQAVDEAAQEWGVKVMRYEIKDITPPATVMEAMERQMKAEREKRGDIALSEGDRQSRINRSEGLKQEAVQISEGEKQKRINEAQGRAQEILLVAEATAQGLQKVAEVINLPGGAEAMNLKVAQQYIEEFGNLAKTNNTMIIPADLGNMASMVASVTEIVSSTSARKSCGFGKGGAGKGTAKAGTDVPPKSVGGFVVE
ncbi:MULTISPECIES: stomatin-like protein [unclassified Pseudodesulfovibrio]|uniref:SPFH domain-containing protein n=1 Tax=unclassified Pseudodesulfovibrio TaxID=2661612 RepID=UPI000FEB9BC5|nr:MULTISPECIES: stomatin-like protein [unclassified Pseudodesulfovibrio]MCJ2165098.1 paraslipin [Pseudodesulfovibrio sp. S3-i]RWU03437.1 paraslipin [Pseudodesulfovibrio sp. S3]